MKIIQFLLIFLIVHINYTFAINPVDSLQRVLETDIGDEEKINIYIELSETLRQKDAKIATDYIDEAARLSAKIKHKALMARTKVAKIPILAYQMKYDEASDLGYAALSYYKTMSDTARMLVCYNSLGILQKLRKNTDKAAEIYKQAIKIAGNNPKTKASLLMNLANIQDFAEATQTSFAALSILESLKDSLAIGSLNNNIGILYKEQQQYETALKHFQLSLKALENSPNQIEKINANINTAGTYGRIDSVHLAYEYYKKALSLSEEIGYDKYIIITKTYIASYYAIHGEDKKAAAIVAELEGLQDKMRLEDISSFYSIKSTLFENKKQYQLALKAAEKAFQTSEGKFVLKVKVAHFSRIANLHEKLGNYKAAYRYFVKYKMTNDSLVNQDNLAELRVQAVEHEFNQKQLVQAQTFQTKQELAEKTIRLRNITSIGLVIALMLMAGWGFTIFKAKQQGQQYAEQLEQEVTNRTQDLQTSNKKLEQANYELRTFNYIASHDIKEPIRVIGGYVSLIHRELPVALKEKLGDYFNTIKRSTTQLYTLVEDFAYYSTLSKDASIEKQPTDLDELTRHVIDTLQDGIAKYNGEVIMTELPTIQSSRSLLFITLKNLIENGLKYNESEQPTVKIDYQSTETEHQIIVSDNGIGIASQYHDKIFENLKRLHNRAEYEGSGIGLAIVKLVVEKLDGTIEVKSEVGEGSQFILGLPK